MSNVRTLFGRLAAVSMLGLMLGCSSEPAAPPADETQPATPEAEEHSHGDGPHGGTISDWGGGAYHVEFTVDHDKKQATVYVLGSDGKTPKPIKADKIRLIINEPSTELDLTAQPMEGEPAGTSSRFVGTHENIGVVREFEGTISGEVEGTPYVGEFKELP